MTKTRNAPLDDATDDELAKLPANQCLALTKLLRDRWSYKAIAAYMDTPVGTVRSRVNRARRRIAGYRAARAPAMEAAQ